LSKGSRISVGKKEKTSVDQELIKLMASFDPFEGQKRAFDRVNRFLMKHYSQGPLVVFSRPLNDDGGAPLAGQGRVYWNKNALGHVYSEELVDKLSSDICQNNLLIEKNWRCFKEEDKNIIAIQCGTSGKQDYYGLMEVKEELSESDFLDNLALFLKSISRNIEQLNELKKIENLVFIDEVTGLYNQRKLYKDLDKSVLRYKELKEKFCILFIDIDHFKQVNDGHGHMIGTQLLSDVAEVFRTTLRETDLIYRYGGDEFVMLIPDVEPDLGKQIGIRILDSIKDKVFKIEKNSIFKNEGDFKLTVSIGVASYPQDAKTRDEILCIADRMMYEAKQSGRGKVCYTRDIFSDEDFLRKKA
jgi:diguanylate cyclase (GGDEF)-like protein